MEDSLVPANDPRRLEIPTLCSLKKAQLVSQFLAHIDSVLHLLNKSLNLVSQPHLLRIPKINVLFF